MRDPKPGQARRGKRAAEISESGLATTGEREANVYTRDHNGVNVLMFVAGDEIAAEPGLGIGVQPGIAAEITSSP